MATAKSISASKFSSIQGGVLGFNSSGGASPDPGPGPTPDPWATMKPITGIVIEADSIGKNISYATLNSLTLVDGVGTFTSSNIFNTGELVEFRGINEAGIYGRGVVTAGAAAGSDVAVKMLESTFTGSATNANTVGNAMRVAYGRMAAPGFLGYAAALSGKWPRIPVWGAFGGSTIEQIIGRLPVEVIPNRPSHVLFVMGSNNYGSQTAEEIIFLEKQACDICTVAGIQVLLMSCTPGNANSNNAMRQEINAAMKEWCDTQDDVFFVDVWDLLADPVTGAAQAGVLYDNVHLTPYGYRLGIQPLLDVFNKYAMHFIPADAENRIANAAFTEDTPSGVLTGRQPVGCTLGKNSGAAYAGTTAVENGEWVVNITGAAAGDWIGIYTGSADAYSVWPDAVRQSMYADLKVESASDVNFYFQDAYRLNSDTAVGNTGSMMLNSSEWAIPAGNTEWWTLAGRDLPIQAGDSFAAGRPTFRVLFPSGGDIKITVRRPGAVSW